jgi:hypothetical protein
MYDEISRLLSWIISVMLTFRAYLHLTLFSNYPTLSGFYSTCAKTDIVGRDHVPNQKSLESGKDVFDPKNAETIRSCQHLISVMKETTLNFLHIS